MKSYFDRCKNEIDEKESSSVERTSNALNVGVATVKRVMATYNRNPDLLEKGTSERGRPPHVISHSIQTLVRSYIRKANQEGRHITLEILREHLESFAPEQSIYARTLARTLDRWGFDVEALAVARKLGYVISERPIRWVNDPSTTVSPMAYLDVLKEVVQVRINMWRGVYENRSNLMSPSRSGDIDETDNQKS